MERSDRERPPLLAITMGDPAGIGPEVVLKAATVQDVRAECELIVYGDAGVLKRAASELSIAIEIVELAPGEAPRQGEAGLSVRSMPPAIEADFRWAQPSERSDKAQIEYILAAHKAVSQGQADAIVTGPINKAALRRAGAKWPGHTEMLAELSGSKGPLMMLAGPTLKVVPITTHISLAEVPKKITRELIGHALRVTHKALREQFGCLRPRIGVAGLNPHAGEGGLFGVEEAEIIRPAVEAANADGILAVGPLAPDSVFNRAAAGEFDVVIGMYHDQALIPLKLLDFDRAVNVTLGLPIIRTSVDHGTAYDIAGRGVASAHSMIEAMRLAAHMVRGARPA